MIQLTLNGLICSLFHVQNTSFLLDQFKRTREHRDPKGEEQKLYFSLDKQKYILSH